MLLVCPSFQRCLVLLTAFHPLFAIGQQLEFSEWEQSLVDSLGMEFHLPVDGGYKQRPIPKSESEYQILLRSKQEKMEIRYRLEPELEGAPTADKPQLMASRLALHLCKNSPDAFITGHGFDDFDSRMDFGADWAKLFTFPPKTSFGNYEYCRMLALYKAGRGMIYVFFLFDDPPDLLEYRLYAAQFLK